MAEGTIEQQYAINGLRGFNDCNDMLITGIYGINPNVTNKPSNMTYAICIVFNHTAGGWTLQIAADVLNYKLAYRLRNNANSKSSIF